MSLYFLISSLNLLRPKGHLGFLLPGKLMQARYAATIRQWLTNHCSIDYLFDYGIDHKYLFKADTFPLVLGLSNCEPDPKQDIQVERYGFELEERFKLPRHRLAIPNGAWVLQPKCFAAFQRQWQRLGDLPFPIHRGIVTNAKRHFVFESEPNHIPRERFRPLVRGRDLKGDRFAPSAWIYWPFALGPDWYHQLPEAERLWLGGTSKLRFRASHVALPYRPREFAPWLLVWKYLANEWQVALCQHQDWLPDQTTYYLECPDFETAYRLFAWLNHPTVNDILKAMAERGKDRCFFYYAHTCADLPVPPDLLTRPMIIPESRAILTPNEGKDLWGQLEALPCTA